jgi:hypothetical protein
VDGAFFEIVKVAFLEGKSHSVAAVSGYGNCETAVKDDLAYVQQQSPCQGTSALQVTEFR